MRARVFRPTLSLVAAELVALAVVAAGARLLGPWCFPLGLLVATLVSRGLAAQFDCADAKRDLDWHPVADKPTFIARAVDIHRTPFERVA